MKFGNQFSLRQFPDWKESYLNFHLLKNRIKISLKPFTIKKNDGTFTEEDQIELSKIEDEFMILVNNELEKVNTFYLSIECTLVSKAQELKERYQKAESDNRRASVTATELASLRREMIPLSTVLEQLKDFASLNTIGFRKILKKHDKNSVNSKICQEFLAEKVYKAEFHTSTNLVEVEKTLEALTHRVGAHHHISNMKEQEVVKPEAAPVIENFQLSDISRGTKTRMWVPLIEDGLSQPISVPVVVARGRHKGPVVGITAALHGNELNGIPLIHRLFHDLDIEDLCGTVVAIPVVNVVGYLQNKRTFADNEDPNRVFPGAPNKTCSKVFTYRFLHKIVNQFEYLIDLHTASFGKINSLYVRADMNDPITARMALLQNPQIIVHNTGPDGSLRGASAELGIKAITVEIGDPQRFQERYIKYALIGVHNILSFLKMIPHEEEKAEFAPVLCSSSYWLFTDVGGVLQVLPEVNSWVRKGQLIAMVSNIFGDLIKKYYSPDDGIVIGKNANPMNQTGDRILHLGVISDHFSKVSQDGR